MAKHHKLTKPMEKILLALLEQEVMVMPEDDNVNHRHYTLIRRGLAYKDDSLDSAEILIRPSRAAHKWLKQRGLNV